MLKVVARVLLQTGMCEGWLRKLKVGIEKKKKSTKEGKEEGWNRLKVNRDKKE